ncbi:MAG TPA: helix-turn-helix domain-containing protein [Blastocatellia bacterium]|nr:helix-turn-helix domain-containing protein [Blastocatellia bacterium]
MALQITSDAWLSSQPRTGFAPASKGRLLISISDRYLRTLLEAVLQREGYETTIAQIESIELSSNGLHDLLLADIDTIEHTSNLADLMKNIRILMLDWGQRSIPASFTKELAIVDPLRTDMLLLSVQYLSQVSRMERENRLLRRALSRGIFDDQNVADASEGGPALSDRVEQFERNLITSALRRTQGCQVRAASLLGVKNTTLNMKLKRYGIEASSFRQPSEVL